MKEVHWQDVADLPFAAALTPHRGGLGAGGDYDGVHFDQLSFDEPQAASSRFIECAFTGVTLPGRAAAEGQVERRAAARRAAGRDRTGRDPVDGR